MKINESENWLQSNQGLLEYDWASSFCFALGYFFLYLARIEELAKFSAD